MTDTVVPFPAAKTAPTDDDQYATGPHGSGPAHCLQCGHHWSAMAPVGTTWLDCPECGSGKGIFTYPFLAAEGDSVWTCPTCGSQVFYITPEAFHCYQCGKAQVFS